jgi:hypothetical protein
MQFVAPSRRLSLLWMLSMQLPLLRLSNLLFRHLILPSLIGLQDQLLIAVYLIQRLSAAGHKALIPPRP